MRAVKSFCLSAGLLWLLSVAAFAQQKAPAPEWIWVDAGNPAQEAAAGQAWFRTEVRAHGPSTGQIRVACDDAFVLWVNGQRVGEGDASKSYRFNLNGIVERGINVIAIEATNKSGRAGLYVDGVIRSQDGDRIPFVSNAQWKVTTEKPSKEWLQARFEGKGWSAAKSLGQHAGSPWAAMTVTDTAEDRFDVPAGFQVQKLAGPDLCGSAIAITWGNRGRLLVSRERGGIYALSDENGDGVYDKSVEYTSAVVNCQGLCVVGDDLYAVGMTPEPGKVAGLYRLPDKNHDDKADSVELLAACKGGIGEHGPHDVVFGPDGWLYHNLGNHAWVTQTPQPTTAGRDYEEGYLLEPKFEDANGHASGIKAPGGTIWRFTPDGKQWWLETNGFRNEYDVAFNSRGDLFSFDSDMEWDVGLPWYRPVRIYHCIPGAEFGWRSGAAKQPAYNFDLLPPTIDVGRGSPTGVVFYEHNQFPKKYQGTMLNCDWSMGRIIVAKFEPDGASYKGSFETLVSGNPLNVSDIEVDLDGTVVFSTGGRRTEGGIYRVKYVGEGATADVPAMKTIEDALHLPQIHAGWARDVITQIKAAHAEAWENTLQEKVQQGTPAEKVRALTLLSQFGPKPGLELLAAAADDADPQVRQFAVWLLGSHSAPEVSPILSKKLQDQDAVVQRRACEAFVRSGLEAPLTGLLPLLGSSDRWMRFAARLALERVPSEKWEKLFTADENVDVRLQALLALHRLGKKAAPPEAVQQQVIQLLNQPTLNSDANVDRRMKLDAIRLLELSLLTGVRDPALTDLGKKLLAQFQALGGEKPASRDEVVDAILRESARVLAVLQVEGAAPVLVKAMTVQTDLATGLHYALCLRYLKTGWDFTLKRELLDWYETTREWEGGNSLQGYVRNIVAGSAERFTPDDRKTLLTSWQSRPFATRMLLGISTPDNVKDFDQVVDKLLKDVESMPGHAQLQELVSLTIEALGKSRSEAAQKTLRKLFDQYPDRREQIVRIMSAHATEDNWPYFVKALQFGDGTTLQQSLKALGEISLQPKTPDEFRSAIFAALKLGNAGGMLAIDVLQKWTGVEHHCDKDLAKATVFYQGWFTGKFPQAPFPALPKIDVEKTKYSFEQLVNLVEKGSQGINGDVARGRAVFAKANCIKCHRFNNEGEGIGPDLTTVRRRFQKREIIESVLNPSQVISDQYKSLTIATTDGLVYSGMPVPDTGVKNAVVLLLSDATRVTIPKNKIEDQQPAKISVMPEGLLKELSLQDVADLFAFLETSRTNAEPGQRASAK
ncbi:MAG: HEAT repeat domain-containing protein [Planctomycetales bacterium]